MYRSSGTQALEQSCCTIKNEADVKRCVLSVLRDEVTIAVLQNREVERHVTCALASLALHLRVAHVRSGDWRLVAKVAQHVLLAQWSKAGASERHDSLSSDWA